MTRLNRSNPYPRRHLYPADTCLVMVTVGGDEHTPPFAWCPDGPIQEFVTTNRIDLNGTIRYEDVVEFYRATCKALGFDPDRRYP